MASGKRNPLIRIGAGIGRLAFGELVQERFWSLAILIALIALRLADPAPIEFGRVKGFDLYQQLSPASDPRRAVVIVDIDEQSMAEIGQWPWPRTVIAKLVDRLAQYNVAAIGFDVVFPEPDRTSPPIYSQVMTGLPEPLRAALSKLPSNDEVFASAIGRSRVILGAALRPEGNVAPETFAGPVQFAQLGSDPRPYLFAGGGLVGNLKNLTEAASGVGLITNYPEFDGIVRRVPALYRVKDQLFPALGVEMIRAATGASTIVVRTGPDGVEGLIVARVLVPTDANGRLWVHYGPSDPDRYVSAQDVLAGRVPAERLQGRLVLVGTSASGLLDIKSTPVSRAIPGVEVHAQLIENVLFERTVQRPGWALSVETLVTVIMGLVLIWFVPRLGPFKALFVGSLVMAPLIAAAWFAFTRQGLLFDIVYPTATTLIVYSFLAFVNYIREERKKRRIHHAFAHYLAPPLVERLSAEPDKLVLGGEMRELSVLFSDVRGFSGISEGLSAQELTKLINDLMTPMADTIIDYNGTIDKFIGDAIMAFWNAPIDDPNHARNACLAALAMRRALADFNVERTRTQPDAVPLDMGIGINTGPCCVGNLGTETRFDYSAIGDAVNVASRLEGETKAVGAPIIIGEETYRLVPEMAALEIGTVVVKGRKGESRIFALLGDEEFARSPDFAELERLHGLLAAAAEGGNAGEARRLAEAFDAAGADRAGTLAGHYLNIAEQRGAA